MPDTKDMCSVNIPQPNVFHWITPTDEFAGDIDCEKEGKIIIKPPSKDDFGNTIVSFDYSEYADEDYDSQRNFCYNEVEEQEMQIYEGNTVEEKVVVKFESKPLKKSSRSKTYPCPKCDRIWNWPWELRRHLITHAKEKEKSATTEFKCEICGKPFTWKRDLCQHMRLHTGEKLLECGCCLKKFTTRQSLLHHIVVHTGERPFQCGICGNRFTQPANLRTHTKKKHGEMDTKNGKCLYCNEKFNSIIQIHQHIVDDHASFLAEGKELKRIKKLERLNAKQRIIERRARIKQKHRKKIMDKHRSMSCVVENNVPKGFTMDELEAEAVFEIADGVVYGFDWNKTESSGELSCTECTRMFNWRYEAIFHQLCHLVKKSADKSALKICPECKTVFKTPIGLKHHLLIHTKERPYQCLHCWTTFSSHIDLVFHLKKFHVGFIEGVDVNTVKRVPKRKKNSTGDADKFWSDQEQSVASVLAPKEVEKTLETSQVDTLLLMEECDVNIETVVVDGEEEEVLDVESFDAPAFLANKQKEQNDGEKCGMREQFILPDCISLENVINPDSNEDQKAVVVIKDEDTYTKRLSNEADTNLQVLTL